MKLIDILEKALSRSDETMDDIDKTALSVTMNGINQAYVDVRSTIDRRIKPYTTVAANVIELPQDCIEVSRVVHSIDGEYSPEEYYRDGDHLHFFPEIQDGEFDIFYVQAPVFPVADLEPEEEGFAVPDIDIDVKHMYVNAIIAYAAYSYQLYRRKYSAAQLLLQEYQVILQPEAGKAKN